MVVFPKSLMLLSMAMMLFFSTTTNAGFFDSDSEPKAGREYLESVQKTVDETVKKVSSGVVFLQLALKKPGRTNSITLNGVVIDDKGHVATLYFKEGDVTDVKAWIGEEEYTAKIVKADMRNMLTIIKIETSEKTQPIVFGDTSTLVTGQFIVGVNATSKNLAFEPAASFGSLKAIIEGSSDSVLVSGMNLTHNVDIPTLGMPIFNLDGEAIAISQGRSIVPIDGVAKAAKMFANRGDDDSDEEPWIGINYEAVSEELSQVLKLPRESIRITRVYRDSPASKGGLLPGDVITSIDGKKITRRGVRALSQIRKYLEPEIGRQTDLEIIRNGKDKSLSVIFDEKPKVTSISIEEFGLTVNDISSTDYYRYNLKVNEGVLVTGIEGGSPAATSTYFGRPLISRGDVITEVHGFEIKNIKDLRGALEKLREKKESAVFIRLQRGNRPTSVSLDTAIGQKTKDRKEK
ncbi:MAG: PDZ domain-containing protein [Lentisphaeraceae bacterium]|nr:PDZ domain-containing protein [Lentisphaeraceae bacterium]